MSDTWLALVGRRLSKVCGCAECVLAGCDRPPVELRRTSRHPSRWLHGRDLERFYLAEDEATRRRNDVFDRLKHDLKQIGGKVLRGSEL